MAGPLPHPNRRRRNAPTIPTTDLPVGGRKGRAPDPPKWLDLGPKAFAWWNWAWRTPQAAGWSKGDIVVIARRAQLEDDMAALESTTLDHPPDDDASPTEWRRYARDLEIVMGILAKIARGSLAVEREMRELDDRLGLTPKALAQLRWKIVPDPEKPETGDDDGEDNEIARRRAERAKRLAAGS